MKLVLKHLRAFRVPRHKARCKKAAMNVLVGHVTLRKDESENPDVICFHAAGCFNLGRLVLTHNTNTHL